MLNTTLVGVITAALMSTLSIGTGTVLPAAPGPEPEQPQTQVQAATTEENEVNSIYTGTGCFYIDENGDGICDNYDGSQAGNGSGRRHNFTDENGDGICDYCTLTSDCGLHENCPSGYSGQTRHHNSGCGNGSRRGCHR